MTDHPFDQAMALSVVGEASEGRFEGLPSRCGCCIKALTIVAAVMPP